MKIPRITNAIDHIDDDLIVGSERSSIPAKRKVSVKWVAIAACLTVIIAATAVFLPMMLEPDDTVISSSDDSDSESEAENSANAPIGNEDSGTEAIYEMRYFYQVEESSFSTYVGGKVISESKIGDKLSDVSVIGGWKNSSNEWISTEKLRAEIYLITGVSSDVAVALRFIDEGEALTTTHYYVIMNPDADLSSVEDYIIKPDLPNNPGDEMAGEVLE